MKRSIFALAAVLSSTSFAQAAPDDSVPVEHEPQHKTVFKNDFVQAFRVRLQPGQVSLTHRHEHDDAAVRLSTNTSTSQSPGEAEGAPQLAQLGHVTARDNETRPTIHRVRNVGTTLFDVIDVQILSRPPGPESAAIGTPVAENPKMRMYRYELAAGASVPSHTHARPYLLVAVTAMKLHVTTPGGMPTDEDVAAGDMRWVDSAATHIYANAGRESAILVEFELR